ncbi:hypothetical protein Vretimale_2677 [Volvox reticuliferus]|uniref:Uncharacterized protein n=1 Tax=Volvox reticuliferus TaxID=1737510 RepID=A0A8J4BXY4_9CHLO|nr:hypothetical protein Vretifemale_2004 [Volvox reticuliferus]GIL96954.1 hypothetical protein Vretimale_2677 [Volvox reticuliferus]
MQRPKVDDLCSSSFSSSDMDMDLARQEELLVEKYGRLQLKQRALIGKKQTRRYFDSADWSLQKQGKLIPDLFLDFDCPIDQLPVKLEPTLPGQRNRSHLDMVGWVEPVSVNTSRTVLDI